jgi:hypothetical protein
MRTNDLPLRGKFELAGIGDGDKAQAWIRGSWIGHSLDCAHAEILPDLDFGNSVGESLLGFHAEIKDITKSQAG